MISLHGSTSSHGSAARARLLDRARRRRGQRGAVMFIVAMTLAVIGAMGVYALQMASTEVRTAGFVRQQVQTEYLNQFGGTALQQSLNTVGPQLNTIMTQMPDGACYSLYGIPSFATLAAGSNQQSSACHRADAVELGGYVNLPGLPVTLLPAYGGANSDSTRGAVGIPLSPFFYAEITDPTPRQAPAKYATNATSPICFIDVTVSSLGMTPTPPIVNPVNPSDSTSLLTEGFEMGRGRMVFGPLPCPGTN